MLFLHFFWCLKNPFAILLNMKMTKSILTYSIIAGLFAVLFIPFIVPQGMFFPFITGKGFTFRILVEILFGLYAVLAVISPEYRPKLSWLTKSVIFFTLAILVADLLSVNAYKSLWSNYERMEGFVLIAHLFLYYFVASGVLNSTKRWNQFFNVSIVTSFLMSFYGLLQLAGKLTINQGGVRLDGTFGNASYFAIYLVFHIFLCLYQALGTSKAKWLKWTYICVAVFETIILYFTATRGAILGLIGGLFLAFLLVAWKEKENIRFRKVAYGVLGAVALFIIGFMALRNTCLLYTSEAADDSVVV
jgi:hypothetical protein